ncbi:hypothetical protein I7I48_08428 [Histoplasma ohiense]|nr:hypothetical protein I7I48_08428 [Histoplasma ohiense (nom. inval.)]
MKKEKEKEGKKRKEEKGDEKKVKFPCPLQNPTVINPSPSLHPLCRRRPSIEFLFLFFIFKFFPVICCFSPFLFPFYLSPPLPPPCARCPMMTRFSLQLAESRTFSCVNWHHNYPFPAVSERRRSWRSYVWAV